MASNDEWGSAQKMLADLAQSVEVARRCEGPALAGACRAVLAAVVPDTGLACGSGVMMKNKKNGPSILKNKRLIQHPTVTPEECSPKQ